MKSSQNPTEISRIIAAEKENIRNEINKILWENKYITFEIEEMFMKSLNTFKMFWKPTVYKDPALNFLNRMNSRISNISSVVNLEETFKDEERVKFNKLLI